MSTKTNNYRMLEIQKKNLAKNLTVWHLAETRDRYQYSNNLNKRRFDEVK